MGRRVQSAGCRVLLRLLTRMHLCGMVACALRLAADLSVQAKHLAGKHACLPAGMQACHTYIHTAAQPPAAPLPATHRLIQLPQLRHRPGVLLHHGPLHWLAKVLLHEGAGASLGKSECRLQPCLRVTPVRSSHCAAKVFDSAPVDASHRYAAVGSHG